MDATATRSLPFVYHYKDHEGKDCESQLEITFPFEQESLEECVTQLMSQMDPMMRYLDENISKSHQALIKWHLKEYVSVRRPGEAAAGVRGRGKPKVLG